MKLDIRELTRTDWAVDFVPNLRPEDAEEWRAYSGSTPLQLLGQLWHPPLTDRSKLTISRAVYDKDGTPLCVFGVSPHHGAIGWVWLVATPECVSKSRHMYDYLYRELRVLRAMYPLGLYTESWKDNPLHQSWLQWLGFKKGFERTIHGEQFYQYMLFPETTVGR